MNNQTLPENSDNRMGASAHTLCTLQDIGLEREILAEVLLSPNAFSTVAHIPQCAFSTTQHRIVWAGMLACHKEGKIPDLPTLALELRASGKLDAIGGQLFLAQLFDTVVHSGCLEQHAVSLLERHQERLVVANLKRVVESGRIDGDALAEIETQIETLKKVQGKPVPVDRDERLKLELQTLSTITDPVKRVRKRAEICTKFSISKGEVEGLLTSMSGATTQKARRYTAAEFRALEPEGVNWVIPGLLPGGSATVFAGPAGVGKTTLAYDAAACVLFGEEFLGEKPNKTGKVLFVASDEPQCFVEDKFINRGIYGSDNYSIMLDWDMSQMNELEETLKTEKPLLTVIDSFSSIHKDPNFDENSAACRHSVEMLQAMAIRHNTALLIIHHTTKSKDQSGVGKIRGSSAIGAAGSFVWLLEGEKNSDLRIFTTPKSRSSMGVNLRLALDAHNGRWEVTGGNEEDATHKTIGDRIIEFMMNVPGVKFAAEEISNAIGYGKQSVYKALDRLVQRGVAVKRPSKADARCKVFGLAVPPPAPNQEVSNNSAETNTVIQSQEILDTNPKTVEGGVNQEILINNATILSDPDIDADVLEYVMVGWTKEFKEAVWQLLGEETRMRLDVLLGRQGASNA
ncbi:AAA family ATPase [Aetokthonos hydrillicola Thurmond2011]|jgi:hypothetical protein|uniref:AAA family ATPase n=1 Tax=Aetokthonos hydrillicola Thurmond2011 TaxID=2712845 RepID=A0AAP5I3U8_9CYAN|nr:AAA family ATPase [Aetokthonos hydrillicola]MBO3463571.1 AAA family ATPase [Aetokthonos hydrillicola CCALA 1050]MDR9893274.1 AAA family ATPase [Aetokthonos hydrillicola Thurmond2011]